MEPFVLVAPELGWALRRTSGVTVDRYTSTPDAARYLGAYLLACPSRVRQSLGVSDSVLSKHLKVLEGAGYVEATKARGRRTPIPGPRSPVTACRP
ncbi:transcriptional regulator [Streptomyces cyaneofuscatus]|uniref:transcriptional regulator n=1 Tax=Streptomyces cyaneofuscatus TaxID=66883 RepID=UPI003655886E